MKQCLSSPSVKKVYLRILYLTKCHVSRKEINIKELGDIVSKEITENKL